MNNDITLGKLQPTANKTTQFNWQHGWFGLKQATVTILNPVYWLPTIEGSNHDDFSPRSTPTSA
jgi:hypothetical protein